MIGLMTTLAMAGCQQSPPPAAATKAGAKPAGAMMAKVPTNDWIGRWVGPEGLFLDIAAKDGPYSGRYTITNRYSLDDETRFEAVADRDTLVFTRAGKALRLRAGSGDDTGMKWLAGKADCLVVVPGEGYCRP